MRPPRCCGSRRTNLTTTLATAKKVPVTVAYGDGIGPEIMTATLRILDAGGASLALRKSRSANQSTTKA